MTGERTKHKKINTVHTSTKIDKYKNQTNNQK